MSEAVVGQAGVETKTITLYGEEYVVDLRKIRRACIERVMDADLETQENSDRELMERVGAALGLTRQTVWSFLTGGNSKLDTLRKFLRFTNLKWSEVARPAQAHEAT